LEPAIDDDDDDDDDKFGLKCFEVIKVYNFVQLALASTGVKF
jgi:hypothetical protein